MSSGQQQQQQQLQQSGSPMTAVAATTAVQQSHHSSSVVAAVLQQPHDSNSSSIRSITELHVQWRGADVQLPWHMYYAYVLDDEVHHSHNHRHSLIMLCHTMLNGTRSPLQECPGGR